MKRRISLVPSAIDALKTGSIADPQTAGLTIFVSAKGAKIWRYRRRIAQKGFGQATVNLTLGGFPAYTIADAREWAEALNAKAERGEDPRVAMRATKAVETVSSLTVAEAWQAYFTDISTAKGCPLRPSTLTHKRYIYSGDIAPKLANRPLVEITGKELYALVKKKSLTAPVRANRLDAELKVFFGWCASRAGEHAGIELDPNPALSIRWDKAKVNPEKKRKRFLSDDELGWFLQAVAMEGGLQASLAYQRAFLLMALTGCRISEILFAPSREYRDGVWHRDAERMKNGEEHAIPLGPWGRSLIATNHKWVIPSCQGSGHVPLRRCYQVRDRIIKRMGEIAGRPVEHWTPHDLRRTMRSNTRRLKIDTETAEAMMAHKKTGLIEIYDGYEELEEKAQGYAKWEAKLIAIAVAAGVADPLNIDLHALN